jgi:hypothetical protein
MSALAQVSKPVHERYLTYFGKLRQSLIPVSQQCLRHLFSN